MPLKSGQHIVLTEYFFLPAIEYVLDFEANTSKNCKIQDQEENPSQGPKSMVLKF